SFVALGLLMLGGAVALMLAAFEDNIVFFYSPTELQEKDIRPDQRLRIGGLVEEGSIKKAEDSMTFEFRVTDTVNAVAVVYKGILPDLFREGQGVVVEGKMGATAFVADEVLAKHDENYMPPEVADALKKSGQWQHMKEAMTHETDKEGTPK
ncbi:MAG: cytochrome c maturation protein CcmE, partial [Rhodospirillales bacterium]|nr:cytochrome c maturation protein CcmE [Rhodospirillales bacterium]